MKNYCISYRIAPIAREVKTLYVEAPRAELAVSKARRLLELRYPHYQLAGVAPGMDFSSDSEEIYTLVERLRAER